MFDPVTCCTASPVDSYIISARAAEGRDAGQINSFSWSLHSASDANLIGRTSSPNKKKRKKNKYPRSRLFFMNAARNVAPGPSKNKKKPPKSNNNFSRGKHASSGAANGKRHLQFKAAAYVSHFGPIG